MLRERSVMEVTYYNILELDSKIYLDLGVEPDLAARARHSTLSREETMDDMAAGLMDNMY